jgi:hypothetical protein
MIRVAYSWKNDSDPLINVIQQTIRQNFTNGDISYQLDTSITVVPAFPVAWTRRENTLTFLNNPNPFARISDPVRSPNIFDGLGIDAKTTSPRHLFSQHNYTGEWWSGSTNIYSQGTIQYTYTFRPDGYPATARETSVSGKINRWIFEYE